MQYSESSMVLRVRGLALALIATVSIGGTAGCSVTAIENQVVYAEIKSPNLSAAQAMSGVTSALVNQGYDIKLSDKDSGVVISEYRLVARRDGDVPFDIYLQVRTTIRESNSGTTLRMTPACKSQNRINPAAFSELGLVYYSGEPAMVKKYLKKTGIGDWWQFAYGAFQGVVSNVAFEAKTPKDEVHEEIVSRTVSR